MDIIFIRDFRTSTLIGVYDWERVAPQPITLDIEIGLPDSKGSQSDNVTDTIHYGEVVERLRQSLASTGFALVEALGEHVTSLIRTEFGAPWVKVTVTKHNILPHVAAVGIIMERGTRG